MAIGPIIQFFQSIRHYIHPDQDAMDLARESAGAHLNYQRRIVAIAAIGSVLGIAAGIVGSMEVLRNPGPKDDAKMALLLPVFGCVAGILLGTAFACMIAPNEFLTGYIGRKWMRLIGTENILVARIVCFTISIGLPLGLALLILLSPGRRN